MIMIVCAYYNDDNMNTILNVLSAMCSPGPISSSTFPIHVRMTYGTLCMLLHAELVFKQSHQEEYAKGYQEAEVCEEHGQAAFQLVADDQRQL